MNTVEVELRPHIGKNYNKKLNQVVEIEHDQFVVMASVNGSSMVQIGYIGKSQDAPLNGIDTMRALPKHIQEQITQEVAEKLGRGEVKTFVPAPIVPELFGEEEEDDDE